jgi:hypothetical protein
MGQHFRRFLPSIPDLGKGSELGACLWSASTLATAGSEETPYAFLENVPMNACPVPCQLLEVPIW